MPPRHSNHGRASILTSSSIDLGRAHGLRVVGITATPVGRSASSISLAPVSFLRVGAGCLAGLPCPPGSPCPVLPPRHRRWRAMPPMHRRHGREVLGGNVTSLRWVRDRIDAVNVVHRASFRFMPSMACRSRSRHLGKSPEACRSAYRAGIMIERSEHGIREVRQCRMITLGHAGAESPWFVVSADRLHA